MDMTDRPNDDMDSGSWTDFIDDMYCTDYWYDLDSIQDLCDLVEDPYEDYGDEVCGAD